MAVCEKWRRKLLSIIRFTEGRKLSNEQVIWSEIMGFVIFLTFTLYAFTMNVLYILYEYQSILVYFFLAQQYSEPN